MPLTGCVGGVLLVERMTNAPAAVYIKNPLKVVVVAETLKKALACPGAVTLVLLIVFVITVVVTQPEIVPVPPVLVISPLLAVVIPLSWIPLMVIVSVLLVPLTL